MFVRILPFCVIEMSAPRKKVRYWFGRWHHLFELKAVFETILDLTTFVNLIQLFINKR